MEQIINIAFIGIFFCIVNLGQAQGTLKADFSPYPPSVPPLSGSVVVYTPDTNSGGPSFPVSFEISVNANEPVFDTGRIAGGSTAWAFNLDAPTIINGSMFYTGTTVMGSFQIDDMLANRTDFELYAYAADGPLVGQLSGPLIQVPEPRSEYLLITGLALIYFLKKSLPAPI